jgi:hypothetical protein
MVTKTKAKQMTAKQWDTAYYRQLVGATITDFKLKADRYEGFSWPTFKVTLHDGTKVTVQVSIDEEGNAPGFLHGLPFIDNGHEDCTLDHCVFGGDHDIPCETCREARDCGTKREEHMHNYKGERIEG